FYAPSPPPRHDPSPYTTLFRSHLRPPHRWPLADRLRGGQGRLEDRLGPRLLRGVPGHPDDHAVHLAGLRLRTGRTAGTGHGAPPGQRPPRRRDRSRRRPGLLLQGPDRSDGSLPERAVAGAGRMVREGGTDPVTQLKDLAELIRLPAALTVPGDALAGAAAAGTLRGWRPAALAASSACMYWAGMALNDYADRDLDQHERPERPIPSGRVSPRTALRVAGGLTGAGVALAACTGRSAACVALPLAASVWTYDLVAKPSLAGPAVMGTARALDVLLGGSAAPRRALPAALLMGVHTVGVTGLSRGEVHGSSPRAAAAAFGT